MKPKLEFLSTDEIELIHDRSCHVLETIGMRLPAPEALRLLEEAGADIADGDRVRIPRKLVDRALETVPKRNEVTLFALDPERDVTFDTHTPGLSCMTMATHVLDPYTGERRSATNEDLAALVRLADGCDNIRVNGGLVTPQEVPGDFNDWYTWATCIKNTTKHVTGGMCGAQSVLDAMEMASVVSGEREAFLARPWISGWVLTLPPLGIAGDSLESLIEMSRWKIPCILSSGPILGTTSPVTIGGTLVQAHAEILAGIVVSQLVKSGSPVVYTSFARGMDMQTTNVHMASPEFAILKGGMAQLGHWLDLPIRMPGLLRDAKCIDAQAGFETGMVGAVTALCADLIDAMQLDSDLLVDFADVVFCNECMGALQRLSRDLPVDEKSIALEVIDEVGPGGTYLTHDHTFNWFRKELWMPAIMEHRAYESWEADGRKDIRTVALEKTKLLLEQSAEPFVSESAAAQIDAIVENAMRRT